MTHMVRRVCAADFAFMFGEDWAGDFLFPFNLSMGETVAPTLINLVNLCRRDLALRLSFLALINACPLVDQLS